MTSLRAAITLDDLMEIRGIKSAYHGQDDLLKRKSIGTTGWDGKGCKLRMCQGNDDLDEGFKFLLARKGWALGLIG